MSSASGEPPDEGSDPLGEVVELEGGAVLAGRYELERVLGSGGMGTVWKGMHLGLGVPIAVKTLKSDIAKRPDYARRFRREAHAASLVNHPNVVRVLDFGDDKGVLFMVMEYLAGRSLGDVIRDSPEPMPIAEVVRVLDAVADACSAAHAFGIVHRDLKPDNVFLSDHGKTVKVVDFGLAHVDDARDQGPTLTSSDVVAGTPEYMSPEQCRSLAVGPSTDLYAMGCLLTAMLQRRPPFVGGAAIEILARQMFARPPPLARPAGAEPVPALLERLRLDLLAKLPEERPPDGAAVRARLAEAMSEEATFARLPTRKGDEPLGDRAARAPAWRASPPSLPEDATMRDLRPSLSVANKPALLRLSSDFRYGSVDEDLETGMVALGVEMVRVASEAEIGHALAVILDGGHEHQKTLATLAAIRTAHPDTPVLVCGDQLDTSRMNELVAAGASDVIRYPVTSDKLARKVSRLLRHKR